MPGSNHRRYKVSSIEKHIGLNQSTKKTVLYARVSTSSQKNDLNTQLVYLQSKYPGNECISEIGSGMNFKRKKFIQLIERVLKYEARTKYNILTTRVSPKDTSKYNAYTGEEVFRTDSEIVMQFALHSRENWESCMEKDGYHPGKYAITASLNVVHSGLNAARNIGMKFYQRYSIKNLVLVRG